MYTVLQDLRYGFRSLRKSPGFALVAVLTLALGIGVNTGIFSIVDAVLLRPLPFHDPGQLVSIAAEMPGLGLRNVGFSVPEMDDLALRSGLFSEISVVWPVDANLTGGEHPERIELLGVSPNYFSLLGAKPALGRIFGQQDVVPGFAEGVVISDGAWRRLFAADPKVLGHKLQIDNDVYTIVGVMPPGFRHPGRTVEGDVDVWATAGFRAAPFICSGQCISATVTRRARFLPGAIGRLKPGITPQRASAQLEAFAAGLRREYATDYPARLRWNLRLTPLQDLLVGNVRPLLLVLLAAVSLIFLIACANLANLLLARASGRQREIAIRLAVGAGRARLVRQLLTESLLLSAIAGAAGILTAIWVQTAFLAMLPSRLPRLHEVRLDAGVLLFGIALSLVTGVLFGLAPALPASGFDMLRNLKEGSRASGSTTGQSRLRAAFVVSEIALSLVLMVGAGLLLRTFWTLLQVDPGFNARGVISARIWLPAPNDPTTDAYGTVPARNAFQRELLRRAKQLPGVHQAALSTNLPLTRNLFRASFELEGQQAVQGDLATAEIVSVSPEYFSVLGTPLVRGREFAETDQPDSPLVVVVDATAARRFWPNQEAVGKRIKFPRLGPQQTPVVANVVGVVGDVKYDGLDGAAVPHIYFPIDQQSNKVYSIVLRADGDPAAMGESIRREVQAIDPNLPVFGIARLSDILAESLAERRFSAQLVGGFAVLAALLAGIGVYGVVAYSVAQRTHEIGIRMALGARTSDVLRLVLFNGMRLAWIGVAIGQVCGLAASRLLGTLLFGVSARDPLVFAGIAALLVLVALAASYIPARRASRVDPLVALRCD
jgi:predicted permease